MELSHEHDWLDPILRVVSILVNGIVGHATGIFGRQRDLRHLVAGVVHEAREALSHIDPNGQSEITGQPSGKKGIKIFVRTRVPLNNSEQAFIEQHLWDYVSGLRKDMYLHIAFVHGRATRARVQRVAQRIKSKCSLPYPVDITKFFDPMHLSVQSEPASRAVVTRL